MSGSVKAAYNQGKFPDEYNLKCLHGFSSSMHSKALLQEVRKPQCQLIDHAQVFLITIALSNSNHQLTVEGFTLSLLEYEFHGWVLQSRFDLRENTLIPTVQHQLQPVNNMHSVYFDVGWGFGQTANLWKVAMQTCFHTKVEQHHRKHFRPENVNWWCSKWEQTKKLTGYIQ